MTKSFRQAQIQKLVRRQAISTQEELSGALAAVGVHASQVTLSRDIRELGLVKTAEGYRDPATLPQEAAPDDLPRVLDEALRDIQLAQNLVVLKTSAGSASRVALVLDQGGHPEVVGTVAGDDTVFVATPSPAQARKLQSALLMVWRAGANGG